MGRGLGVTGGLLIAVVLLTPALAGNMVHPRTPVLWPDAPCITAIDRSADPVFEFGYTIPFEDTNLSSDELADSRRHQFIAFCRQWPAGTSPPSYITLADLERAIDADQELPEKLDDPEATLELSREWAGCWTRVTLDDERRPITFADAAEPVVWDTTDVEAGTWLIAGYTWEPPFNMWRRAPWVVRVFDDASDPNLQPAATVMPVPEAHWPDEPMDVELCLATDPAAEVRLAWATTEDDPMIWHEGDPVPVDGATSMMLPFETPTEAWGLTVVLRADVLGGNDSGYAAYPLNQTIVFLPGGLDGEGETEDSTDSSGDPDAGESSESGGPSVDEGSDTAGCNCSANPTRGNLAWLFGLLVLTTTIRRAPKRPS